MYANRPWNISEKTRAKAFINPNKQTHTHTDDIKAWKEQGSDAIHSEFTASWKSNLIMQRGFWVLLLNWHCLKSENCSTCQTSLYHLSTCKLWRCVCPQISFALFVQVYACKFEIMQVIMYSCWFQMFKNTFIPFSKKHFNEWL